MCCVSNMLVGKMTRNDGIISAREVFGRVSIAVILTNQNVAEASDMCSRTLTWTSFGASDQ